MQRDTAAMSDWAIDESAETHYTKGVQPTCTRHHRREEARQILSPMAQPHLLRVYGQGIEQKVSPTASSFPSGGPGATFEARGYSAWTRPAGTYIMDKPNGRSETTCHPNGVRYLWTGEALIRRSCLRSMRSDEARQGGSCESSSYWKKDAQKSSHRRPLEEIVLIARKYYGSA